MSEPILTITKFFPLIAGASHLASIYYLVAFVTGSIRLTGALGDPITPPSSGLFAAGVVASVVYNLLFATGSIYTGLSAIRSVSKHTSLILTWCAFCALDVVGRVLAFPFQYIKAPDTTYLTVGLLPFDDLFCGLPVSLVAVVAIALGIRRHRKRAQ